MGGGGMDALYGSQRGSLGLGMVSRGSLGFGPGMGGGSLGFGGARSQMAGLKNDNENMMAGMKRNTDDLGDGGMKRRKMDRDDDS